MKVTVVGKNSPIQDTDALLVNLTNNEDRILCALNGKTFEITKFTDEVLVVKPFGFTETVNCAELDGSVYIR